MALCRSDLWRLFAGQHDERALFPDLYAVFFATDNFRTSLCFEIMALPHA